jgi:hypothetical protein
MVENLDVHNTAVSLPTNMERHIFAETQLTAYRLSYCFEWP